MNKKDFNISDMRRGVEILRKAELEFKKKLDNHSMHSQEKSYWALSGCDECYFYLIKSVYDK